MKRGSSRDQSLKLYAAAKKYGRRHDLQRDEHIKSNSLVEYSKCNPDEEDTAMEAQWRIREAQQREKSIRKRVTALINSLLGSPWNPQGPSVITGHILLGSREDASNREQLYDAGITHICNCAKQVSNSFEGEFVYIKLNLHDSTSEELIPHFQTVAKFLKRVEVLRGRALIHCISGVSRSPALLIAYLMIDKRMRLLDAYNLVRRKRRSIQPNQAFRLQLAKYENNALVVLYISRRVRVGADQAPAVEGDKSVLKVADVARVFARAVAALELAVAVVEIHIARAAAALGVAGVRSVHFEYLCRLPPCRVLRDWI